MLPAVRSARSQIGKSLPPGKVLIQPAVHFHFCKIARILSSTQKTDTYSQFALICSQKFNYYLCTHVKDFNVSTVLFLQFIDSLIF